MSRLSGVTGRIRPIAVVLTLASLLVAGVFAQLRDDGLEHDVHRAEVGTTTVVADGQTLTVTAATGGTFLKGTSTSTTDVTAGRFLLVTLRTTTATRRNIAVLNCALRTHGGGTLQTVRIDSVSMPSPGFRLTQAMVFEVAVDDLEGARLVCSESSPLLYRSSEVVTDLGLTGGDFDEFVRTSATASVSTFDDVLEVDE